MSSTICYCRGSGISLGQGCSGNFRDSSQIHNPSYPPSLTSSRIEYLRVVGIHSDGLIEREISLVYSVSQHFAPSSARNAVVATLGLLFFQRPLPHFLLNKNISVMTRHTYLKFETGLPEI